MTQEIIIEYYSPPSPNVFFSEHWPYRMIMFHPIKAQTQSNSKEKNELSLKKIPSIPMKKIKLLFKVPFLGVEGRTD